ncbi:MAG: hypothetical protein WB564_06450 [Dehalococcoidia bacterium]
MGSHTFFVVARLAKPAEAILVGHEIATLPPACSPYDFGRRAKPWPACAKASAKASGQVARNDTGGKL